MRILHSLFLPVVFVMVSGIGGIARAASPEVILYNGGSPKTHVNSKWGAWGGGEVKRDEKIKYDLDAKESVEVDTLGDFQGVRLDIDPPVDLTPFRERGFLVIRAQFQQLDSSSMQGMPGGGFGPGAPGPAQGGKFGSRRMFGGYGPGAGGGGGFGPPGGAAPGAGAPGFPGTGAGAGSGQQQTMGLEHMRVTFYLDKGAMGVGRFVVDFDDTDENQWTAIRIPLSRFRNSAGASGRLKRIAISGDADDKFWLGQVKLVQDAEVMSVQITANGKPADWTMVGNKRVVQIEAMQDKEVTIEAEINAGVADPMVTWNLTPEANQIPKRGLRIKETFGQVGTYDGWYQVEDTREGSQRKEPFRYKIRVVVKPEK